MRASGENENLMRREKSWVDDLKVFVGEEEVDSRLFEGSENIDARQCINTFDTNKNAHWIKRFNINVGLKEVEYPVAFVKKIIYLMLIRKLFLRVVISEKKLQNDEAFDA